MAQIDFEGSTVAVTAGQTVLEALEAAGHQVPNACRSGICQSCLLQATEGTLPADSQKGLKDTQRAQGFFLACRCVPGSDLRLRQPGGEGVHTQARLLAIRPLAAQVVEVRLSADTPFAYRPGQFVSLLNPAGVTRSYSVASVPELDEAIHLQVALLPEGAMSGWLQSPAAVGASVALLGPHGNCFYVPGAPEQPLLLVGTGTGLAPLYGIARDALHQGHRGPVHLFHGSLRAEGLYCTGELAALALEHSNFHYHPCVLEGPAPPEVTVGAIDVALKAQLPNLAGYRAYLCGAPELVKKLQRQVFLAGVSLGEVFADPFVPAAAKPATSTA